MNVMAVRSYLSMLDKTGWTLEDQILAGQRELRRIRCRVSSFLLIAGLCCAGECMWLGMTSAGGAWGEPELDGFRGHVHAVLDCLFSSLLLVVLTAAPVAGSAWLTRAVVLILVAVLATAAYNRGSCLYSCARSCPPYRLRFALTLVGSLNTLFGAVNMATALCRRSVNSIQAHMWNALFICLAFDTIQCITMALAGLLLCHNFFQSWWWALNSALLLPVCRKPSLRRWLLRPLHRFFEIRTGRAAAAGVAGLVGDCGAHEALAQAKARFCHVSLMHLDYGALARSEPDPELPRVAEPAKLGGCDAFLSHSWHDDPAAKWAALQGWRAAFLRQHAREPSAWLDKCCIDQNNIDADLRCLPVFLSGCAQLVMLCGPTYLTRLWCVMELFAYVHGGGSVERIAFLPVLRAGHEAEDLADIRGSFAAFDARQCACHRPEDKARMLAIINAAFGDVDHFNTAVRAIMDTAGLLGPCGHPYDCSSQGSVSSASSSNGESDVC